MKPDTLSALSCIDYALNDFVPADEEECEHATELPLQNMIASEDEQLMKETKTDDTRGVQHVAVLNCDHAASSGSTTDPDKNSAEAVSDFVAVCEYLVQGGVLRWCQPYLMLPMAANNTESTLDMTSRGCSCTILEPRDKGPSSEMAFSR